MKEPITKLKVRSVSEGRPLLGGERETNVVLVVALDADLVVDYTVDDASLDLSPPLMGKVEL